MLRSLSRIFVACGLILGLTFCGSVAQDTAKPPKADNALNVIEGVRGGRHWVKEKTAPPKSPAESMARLKIEPGLKLELVAAEPLVMDPVAIAFDRNGEMFVVEYGDYPIGPPEGGKPLSRVVHLQDTDGDGAMDRRHVFADGLTFAHSLMPYKGGLIVGAQTKILFLKDTDGDHVADVREVMYDGFTPAHPQMQIGNPRWGLDNWIYLNYGPGQIKSNATDEIVKMPRKDVRFHPKTRVIEADSGLGQFGNTVDRWGHRYYCTNRNPIMTTLLPPDVLRRNPYYVASVGHYDVGKSGGDTRVYPLVAMKSNYLSHAGTHTSACGVTAYTGDWLGESYANSVLVCEPIGHLVTHSKVEPQGVQLVANRARPKADFIASTDTWFRPASLATGPDGALYLADMYRLWVEHPKFLPKEIADQLDWRAGEDRGRIYRIRPDNDSKAPAFQPPTDNASLVKLLESPNGWRQFLGQRLLIEESATDAAPAIRSVLKNSKLATARLHALWTLDGLGQLHPQDIQTGMADDDPHVRRDSSKLAAQFLDKGNMLALLAARAKDHDARVRLQVALTLGLAGDDPLAATTLTELALRDGTDEWFRRGLLTSVKDHAGAILLELTNNQEFIADGNRQRIELLKQLATIVGTRGNVEELQGVFRRMTDDLDDPAWWRAAIVSGLGTGLPRSQGELGRTSLPAMLSKPPKTLSDVLEKTRQRLERNQRIAVASGRKVADRVAAISLLPYQPFEETADTYQSLLTNGQPVEVQQATVDALSKAAAGKAAPILLQQWKELGPLVRGPALSILLRRSDSTLLMLQAMAEQQMQASSLSIDQRVRLLKHGDPKIKSLSTKLFGGAVSSNRLEVAKKYQAALSLDADAARGAKAFQKICAKCHKIDGQGHEAGPDISDVRNRSRLALLYDILDPNAKVEPRFTSYSVRTVDGEVFSGLIGSETSEAVVLKMAEGKTRTINRSEIERIQASNVSLMPEGIEKDVSIQEMADLLEYLKAR